MKYETHNSLFRTGTALETTPIQENIILTRLAGRQLYNAYLREVLKRLDLISQSRDFQKTIPPSFGVGWKQSGSCDKLGAKNIISTIKAETHAS